MHLEDALSALGRATREAQLPEALDQALQQLELDAARLRNRLREQLLGGFCAPKTRSLPTVKG